jgi:hypothetical protein
MTDVDKSAPDAGDEPAPSDYSGAVSPRQLAGGLAIVAAVLVLLIRSRRRRGRKSVET